MKIEKFSFDRVQQEIKPFTTHLNCVLQNVRDAEVLGIWSYLSSLPPDFNINRETLRKHFKIGRDKMEKILKKLVALQLIFIYTIRDERGAFIVRTIFVKCGYHFEEKNRKTPKNKASYPHPENQCVAKKPSSTLSKTVSHPHPENPCTDNQGVVDIMFINKIKSKNKIKNNKKYLKNKKPKNLPVDNSEFFDEEPIGSISIWDNQDELLKSNDIIDGKID